MFLFADHNSSKIQFHRNRIISDSSADEDIPCDASERAQRDTLLVCSGDRSPWCTDSPSDSSRGLFSSVEDTSSESDGFLNGDNTPLFKRGVKTLDELRAQAKRSALDWWMEQPISWEGFSTVEIQQVIQEVDWGFPCQFRPRRMPAVTLLCDLLLKDWSAMDEVFVHNCKPGLNIMNWSHEIRKGEVTLVGQNFVVQIAKLDKMYPNTDILLGAVHHLVKSLRSGHPHCRIYVCGAFPRLSDSLDVRLGTVEFNHRLDCLLQQVAKSLGKVFYVAVQDHFIDELGQFVKPFSKYFLSSIKLSRAGCFIFRSSLMKEMGLIPIGGL